MSTGVESQTRDEPHNNFWAAANHADFSWTQLDLASQSPKKSPSTTPTLCERHCTKSEDQFYFSITTLSAAAIVCAHGRDGGGTRSWMPH